MQDSMDGIAVLKSKKDYFIPSFSEGNLVQ